MLRFLELAGDAVVGTVTQLVAWVQGLAAAGTLDPRGWHPVAWLVLALVLLAGLYLLLRRRRGAPNGLPEMLVSHGEIVLVAEPDDAALGYGLAAPPRAQHRLELTLSNLNPYPVQLLELAVRTRGRRLPVLADAGSVVPPNGAVDVEAELFDLPGDAGVIELYLYSSRGRRRTYRLSAPLEWEPWAQRYRVRGLALKVAPVKVLASQERRRRERRSFQSAKRRERQREMAEAAWRRAEDLSRQMRELRAQAAEQRKADEARAPAAEAGPVPRGPLERPFPGARREPQREPHPGVHAVETVYSGAAAPGSSAGWSGASTVAEPPPAPPAGATGDAGGEARPAPAPAPQAEQPRRRLEFPEEF